jgi:hypothetical protein
MRQFLYKGCGFDSHRGQANFPVCPVWVHTQSNITNIIFILVPRAFLGKTLVSAGHVTLQKLIAQGGVAKYQITCFHRKR